MALLLPLSFPTQTQFAALFDHFSPRTSLYATEIVSLCPFMECTLLASSAAARWNIRALALINVIDAQGHNLALHNDKCKLG